MATRVPEPGRSDNSITALLVKLSAGNREVEAQLIPQVYGELRRLAARYMRAERGNHTLQPTALVNEAYARLVQQPQVPWQSRAHFFATASRLMRHILVDHARARRAGKRGGVQRQVTLSENLLQSQEPHHRRPHPPRGPRTSRSTRPPPGAHRRTLLLRRPQL